MLLESRAALPIQKPARILARKRPRSSKSNRKARVLKPSVSPKSPTMALASSVRLSSSILRYRLAAPLYPTRFSSLRHNLSELRFLSASSSRPGTHIRPIKARLQDDPQKEDPGKGQNENGSVLVKDTSENSQERIVRVELHKEATEAYMAYAMSVLLGRALPDVRDGLKPVHRRILYAMHELGLAS